jgi:hypothetical protein
LQGTAFESTPIYSGGLVVITRIGRIPVVPGDFDFSGTVTANDYAVWRNNFGSFTNAAADANGNGRVDAADYVIWRNNLGQSGVGAGTGSLAQSGVPEPSSVAMALAGSLIFAGRRRRPSGFRRRK